MIFVDTSGFIAAFDSSDAAHERMKRQWRKMAKRGEQLATTPMVFAETVTFLRRKLGWKASHDAGTAILKSSAIQMIHLDGETFEWAWREFTRSGNPKLSFCDASSFVIMREQGISQAVTLDRHFEEAGFQLLPPPARA